MCPIDSVLKPLSLFFSMWEVSTRSPPNVIEIIPQQSLFFLDRAVHRINARKTNIHLKESFDNKDLRSYDYKFYLRLF